MEGAGVGGVWPAALGHDSGREEGEKEQGGPWGRSPAAARVEVARGSLATVAGGHGRGGALAGLGGGRKLGETRFGGDEEALLRPLPWAEVARGGLATKAGGSGRRRCAAREGARGS